jgi:hypothetical protein
MKCPLKVSREKNMNIKLKNMKLNTEIIEIKL